VVVVARLTAVVGVGKVMVAGALVELQLKFLQL
jgi:hypothetical protein